ncbi:MAG: hypothetical protein V3V41_00070 [Candidatus Heimdallarchaeota archaeon]
MSIEFLKSIRETERDCEQKIKNTESEKEIALMEAEKHAVLRIRDSEIQAKEETSKILSGVKNRVEKEYVKMLNVFEEEQNQLKAKSKNIDKKAIDLIQSTIF